MRPVDSFLNCTEREIILKSIPYFWALKTHTHSKGPERRFPRKEGKKNVDFGYKKGTFGVLKLPLSGQQNSKIKTVPR